MPRSATRVFAPNSAVPACPARAARMESRFALFAPSQHPTHSYEIEPVGQKTEQRNKEDDSKHRVIISAVAEEPDQIAQPFARHDQFGTHQQDEGKCQRSTNAVEQLR